MNANINTGFNSETNDDFAILADIDDLVELSDDEFIQLQKSIRDDPSLGLITPEEINCLVNNTTLTDHEDNNSNANGITSVGVNAFQNLKPNATNVSKNLRRSPRLLFKKPKYY